MRYYETFDVETRSIVRYRARTDSDARVLMEPSWEYVVRTKGYDGPIMYTVFDKRYANKYNNKR